MTALEALMGIVRSQGGSGDPETLVEAIQLLAGVIGVDPTAIAEAVAAWLDAHPEATTTVQDGAVTRDKLSTGMYVVLSDSDIESLF